VAEAAALTRAWPALAEALSMLTGKVRETGSGVHAAGLPRAGPGLAAGLLSMLTVLLDSGAAERFSAGLHAILTEADRPDLADRLARDVGILSRLARQESGDWRVFVLPVVTNGEARLLRLFTRPPEGGQDDAMPRRFVVEAELPRLGALQLEGLMHDNRLELILRSREALSEALQDRLVAAHARASALGGLSGELRFAADAEWAYLPVPEAEADTHGVVI
jgi:hypothetical protein